MQSNTLQPHKALALLIIVVSLIYFAHFLGYRSGHEKGWYDAVDFIRIQAGDVVYPPINSESPYSDGILLDNIEYSYTPYYKSNK